jgi:AcrR family transcriptional regulator
LANVKRAGTPPRDRSRRTRGNGIGKDAGGRAQIIDAAIASVPEVGFYRSSTNEIARRADVSWGALQYHFGTREALLLAIVHEIDRRFLTDVEDAHVEGDTFEERITSLYELLARHYDSPTWLVRLQIILNLQHDPDTSADVMAEVMQTAAKGEASVRRLLREAIGTDVRRANTEAVFHALRGFATSVQLSAAVPVDGSRRRSPEAVRIFLRGLADAEQTYAGP